jgi:hypothetical protein
MKRWHWDSRSLIIVFLCILAISFTWSCSKKSDDTTATTEEQPQPKPEPLSLPDPVDPDKQPLFDNVYFKTRHDTFNERYDFAVRQGIIYIKERPNGNWGKLGGDGIPKDKNGKALTDSKIMGLTVEYGDGVAVDEKGRFIHSVGLIKDISEIKWQTNWGWPFDQGPGMNLLEGSKYWTYTNDSMDRNKVYRDQNKHIFVCMVSSVFALSADGQHIHFCDPWTTSDWGYQAPTPYKGRFICESLAGAASTLFIINKYGDMFTQQTDFDISGGNPAFMYTYDDDTKINTDIVENAMWNLECQRRIPDVWQMQNKINGNITNLISIHFPLPGEPGSEAGSSDRVMRVEGMNEKGSMGYFEKRLLGSEWTFHAIQGWKNQGKWIVSNDPDEDTSRKDLGAIEEYNLEGEIKNAFGKKTAAKLEEFSLIAEPALIRISLGNNQWMDLKLHHHFFLRTITRENPGMDGKYVSLSAQIEIPEEYMNSDNTAVRNVLKDYFLILSKSKKTEFVNVRVSPPFGHEEWGIITGIQAKPDSVIIKPEIPYVKLPIIPVASFTVMSFGAAPKTTKMMATKNNYNAKELMERWKEGR